MFSSLASRTFKFISDLIDNSVFIFAIKSLGFLSAVIFVPLLLINYEFIIDQQSDYVKETEEVFKNTSSQSIDSNLIISSRIGYIDYKLCGKYSTNKSQKTENNTTQGSESIDSADLKILMENINKIKFLSRIKMKYLTKQIESLENASFNSDKLMNISKNAICDLRLAENILDRISSCLSGETEVTCIDIIVTAYHTCTKRADIKMSTIQNPLIQSDAYKKDNKETNDPEYQQHNTKQEQTNFQVSQVQQTFERANNDQRKPIILALVCNKFDPITMEIASKSAHTAILTPYEFFDHLNDIHIDYENSLRFYLSENRPTVYFLLRELFRRLY